MVKKTVNFILIVGIISGAVFLSWTFSTPVYNFYNKVYYFHINSKKYPQYLKKTEEMLEETEESKRNIDFERFSEKIILSFPHPYEFYRIAGDYYLEKGIVEKGAFYSLSSIKPGSKDIAIIKRVIPVLWANQYFAEVCDELRKYNLNGRSDLLFYYGSALVEIGESNKAGKYLLEAKKLGYMQPELYYYMGQYYNYLYLKSNVKKEKKDYSLKALMNFKRAYEFSVKSEKTLEKYIFFLKDNGYYSEAADLANPDK